MFRSPGDFLIIHPLHLNPVQYIHPIPYFHRHQNRCIPSHKAVQRVGLLFIQVVLPDARLNADLHGIAGGL